MILQNRSFFSRLLFILVPCSLLVSMAYSSFIVSALHAVENQIVRDHLQRELQQLTTKIETQGKAATLPNTSYLNGYWQDSPNIPKSITHYTEGYYQLHRQPQGTDLHIQVMAFSSIPERLYLVIEEELFSSFSNQLEQFRSQLWEFGFLVMLGSIALTVLIAYMLARPVRALADDVAGEWVPGKHFQGIERNDEFGELSRSFTTLTHRLQTALEREKSFARYASHELRTPLAVIKNAAAVLKLPLRDEEKRHRNIARIEKACQQAEQSTEALLCLGQDITRLTLNEVQLKDEIKRLLTSYVEVTKAKAISLNIVGDAAVTIQAPKALLAVVIDNLLRNAFYHGKDTIEVDIHSDGLQISNPVCEQKADTPNFGYGLEIVQRICDSLAWDLNIISRNGIFVVSIRF